MKDRAVSLVQEFVESLISQADAVHSGTTRQAKYYGDKSHRVANRLISMGEEGIRQFATLLEHPLRKIKVTAAVYLLDSIPDEALAALREVADSGNDFHAQCAQLRIREWERRKVDGR